MTTYDYIAPQPSLPQGQNNNLLMKMSFLILSFLFGFVASELTENRSSYISPSVYYNPSQEIEDWHGNIMRLSPHFVGTK